MANRVRARILITGMVQGVCFRQSTADEARRLGVEGLVRNLRDGSVEAKAEGDRSAVEALVRWCGHGPPAARVERVEVEWSEAQGDLGPFRVAF
jgi:acylphosphatase